MHQNPLRMLTQGGVAKHMQNAALLIVVLSRIDASPGVAEYPKHKIVLLDQFGVGNTKTVRLSNTDE